MKGTNAKQIRNVQKGKCLLLRRPHHGAAKEFADTGRGGSQKIIQAKNDAVKLPQMNLVMAKTYLSAQDPKMVTRTWADVVERFGNWRKMTSSPLPITRQAAGNPDIS